MPGLPFTQRKSLGGKPGGMKSDSVRNWLDHDALAGALLGRLECVFDQMVGNPGEAAGALGAVSRALFAVKQDGFSEVFGLFFDDPEAVAALGEDIRSDLLADAIAGTQILIDPNP